MLDFIKFLMIIVMSYILLFDILRKNIDFFDISDGLFAGLLIMIDMNLVFILIYVLGFYKYELMSNIITIGLSFEFIFLLICYSKLIKINSPIKKQATVNETIKIN